AMTGVVPDHEQTRNPEAGDHRSQNLDPPGVHDQQARDRNAQHQPVEKKPDDRSHDAGLYGERLQQLREFPAATDGRRRRVGSRHRTGLFYFRAWFHETLQPAFFSKSTWYYTLR